MSVRRGRISPTGAGGDESGHRTVRSSTEPKVMGMNVSWLTPRHTSGSKVEGTGCAELQPYQKCTKKPRIEGKGVN